MEDIKVSDERRNMKRESDWMDPLPGSLSSLRREFSEKEIEGVL